MLKWYSQLHLGGYVCPSRAGLPSGAAQTGLIPGWIVAAVLDGRPTLMFPRSPVEGDYCSAGKGRRRAVALALRDALEASAPAGQTTEGLTGALLAAGLGAMWPVLRKAAWFAPWVVCTQRSRMSTRLVINTCGRGPALLPAGAGDHQVKPVDPRRGVFRRSAQGGWRPRHQRPGALVACVIATPGGVGALVMLLDRALISLWVDRLVRWRGARTSSATTAALRSLICARPR